MCDRLNAPSRWEHLGASHLRLVLGLAAGAQERLLATANANRWTVKILEQHVLLEKGARLTRGGRRAQRPFAKSLSSVKRCLDAHLEVLGCTAQLSLRDLEAGIQLAEEAKNSLEHLSQALREAMMAANAVE